jgi:hypothetical protein
VKPSTPWAMLLAAVVNQLCDSANSCLVCECVPLPQGPGWPCSSPLTASAPQHAPAQCSCRDSGQTDTAQHNAAVTACKCASDCWQGQPGPGDLAAATAAQTRMLPVLVQCGRHPTKSCAPLPPGSQLQQCGSVGWCKLLPSSDQQSHTLHTHPQPPDLAVVIHHLAGQGGHTADRQAAVQVAKDAAVPCTKLVLSGLVTGCASSGCCTSRCCGCLLTRAVLPPVDQQLPVPPVPRASWSARAPAPCGGRCLRPTRLRCQRTTHRHCPSTHAGGGPPARQGPHASTHPA